MPTPYTPIPAPFFRFSEAQIDDESSFTSPSTYTPNFVSGTFAIGALSVPLAAQADMAEAIERVFWADLSGPIDPNGYLFNGAAHQVTPVISGGNTLTSVKIGAVGGTQFTWTLGFAASVAALLRVITGTAPFSG